jgi:hypothetical protein
VLALVRRIGLVLAVILTFVALQTGWARTVTDGCDDGAESCVEDDGAEPCAPSCTDCHGCAGPTRALVGPVSTAPRAAMHAVVLRARIVELFAEGDVDRIDRPPRV